MIPWTNSWFQLAAVMAVLSLLLIWRDLSHRAPAVPPAAPATPPSSPAENAPPQNPAPSAPAYNPPSEPSQPAYNPPGAPSQPAYNPPGEPSQPAYNPPSAPAYPPTNPGGEMVIAPGVFAYQAPAGWRLVQPTTSPYKVAVCDRKDNVTENISMNVVPNNGPLNAFVNQTLTGISRLTGLSNTHIVNEQGIRTNAGAPGVRVVLVATRQDASVVMDTYFVDGGNEKLIMVGGCLYSDFATLAPLFEASARSLTLLR